MVKLGEGEVDKFSTGGEGVTWFTRGNEGGMSCLQQNLKEGLKKIDCQWRGIIRIPQGFMGGLRKFNCDIIKLLPPLPLPCIMTGPIERSNSEDILNHKAAWGGEGGT